MKEIRLTKGLVAKVDDADFEYLNQFKWNAARSVRAHTHYAHGRVGGKTVSMHRLILGLTDPEIHTDHKDGDGLNNQRSNIVPCTRSENMLNTRRHRDGTFSQRPVRGVRAPRIFAPMVKFLFNIEPEILEEVKKEADKLGLSVGGFIRKLINDFLGEKK